MLFKLIFKEILIIVDKSKYDKIKEIKKEI